MNRIIYIVGFVFLLSLFAVSADERIPLNQEYTLWADIISNGVFFNVDDARLTLIDPNQTIHLNNQSMIKYSDGIYYYNYSFNITGNWFGFVEFYNTTDKIAIASQTLTVSESTEDLFMTLAIVIGLIALATWLIYVGKELMARPVGKIDKKIYIFLNPRNIGVFLHLAASWVFVALLGFLSISSVARTYESLMESIFLSFIWLVAFFNIGYMAFYIIFSVSEYLNAKNWKLRGGR